MLPSREIRQQIRKCDNFSIFIKLRVFLSQNVENDKYAVWTNSWDFCKFTLAFFFPLSKKILWEKGSTENFSKFIAFVSRHLQKSLIPKRQRNYACEWFCYYFKYIHMYIHTLNPDNLLMIASLCDAMWIKVNSISEIVGHVFIFYRKGVKAFSWWTNSQYNLLFTF